MPQKLIHATAMEKKGQAILLTGKSGLGKSDLALRMLDRGFRLISDDQTGLSLGANNVLTAGVAPNIQGMMELRGIGLVHLKPEEWDAGPFPVAFEIHLVNREDVERMPDPHSIEYLDQWIPQYQLHAFDISVILKIERLLLCPENVTGQS